MTDKSVVVCFRVLDMPHAHVKDRQTVLCSRCGEAVWLSPASAQLLERGVAPLCLPCFRVTDEGGPSHVTPEQIRELEEAGRNVLASILCTCAEAYTSRSLVDHDCFYHEISTAVEQLRQSVEGKKQDA